MSRLCKPYNPKQTYLFPPSPQQWLPEGHLAYFISDLVEQLDISELQKQYSQDYRGQRPYDLRMMLKILIYGYCTGIYSSRRLEKKLREDLAFIFLAAGQQPNNRTLCLFRRKHLEAFNQFFVQVLNMAQEMGASKIGVVVIDGSKVKSNASKHKAMSFDRMLESEAKLRQEVQELLQKAEESDRQEDKLSDKDDEELPAELQRREKRLERIAEAKQALEERAQEKAAQKNPAAEKATEVKVEAKAQYNFTDPESRIMKGPDGFVQAYNVQIAVEPDLQLIVGCAVTQEANDKQQLVPVLEAVAQQAGVTPHMVLADAGYHSENNVAFLAEEGIDGYIPAQREKHGQSQPQVCRGRIPKSATPVDRMKRKLKTKQGRAIYAFRKQIVEPVFGQIKQVRGFRQFLLRGIENVRAEWSMLCLTHNILKLHRIISDES